MVRDFRAPITWDATTKGRCGWRQRKKHAADPGEPGDAQDHDRDHETDWPCRPGECRASAKTNAGNASVASVAHLLDDTVVEPGDRCLGEQYREHHGRHRDDRGHASPVDARLNRSRPSVPKGCAQGSGGTRGGRSARRWVAGAGAFPNRAQNSTHRDQSTGRKTMSSRAGRFAVVGPRGPEPDTTSSSPSSGPGGLVRLETGHSGREQRPC